MQDRNPFDQFDAAPGAGPQVIIPVSPLEQARDQAALNSAQLSAARTQQQIDQDNATAAAVRIKADADARAAVANAGKAEKDASTPSKEGTERNQRIARINSLVRTINDAQRAFDVGPGATEGFSGLWDYFPTDANSLFDTTGTQLAEQGLGAFRIPGTGEVSNRDAIMFERANMPESAKRDVANRRILQNIRNRVEEEAKALGIAAPKWATGDAGSGRDGEQLPLYGDGAKGGVLALSNDGTRWEQDPTKRGVAARINKMLTSGASDADIQRYAASVGASPDSVASVLDFRRKNPGYRGGYDASNLEMTPVQNSAARQAVNAAAQSPTGAFFMSAGDILTPGGLASWTENPELSRAGMAGVRDLNPTASTLGTIGGSAIGAGLAELGAARLGLSGIAAARGGDAAFGAYAGASQAEPGNRLVGAAQGAAGGLVGGMFGRQAARAASGAVGGIRNAAVDELTTRGIPLTVGQAVSQSGRLGAVVKGIEDRLSGVPIVGDMVGARRLEGLQAFNRAAFDEALAPIGQNSAGMVGEEGVAQARQLVGQAYDDALGGVQVRADVPFVGDMRRVLQQADALPSTQSVSPDAARYTLDRSVASGFDNNATMTGRNFQQSLRGLRRDASAVRNQPYGYDFGNVTRGAEDALTSVVERQAPQVVPALNAANQAYGRTGIVRDAVAAARNGSSSGEGGVFAASQLTDAATRNARRFGGTQATPDQPFYNLTTAARDILPNRVPDSGTAGRLATLALPGALGGAGAGADALGWTDDGTKLGLGLGALLTAGGSRTGQRLLTRGLFGRSAGMRRAGDWIADRAQYGGLLGAGLPIALLPR